MKLSPVTVVTDNKTVKADKIVGVSKFLISPVFNFLHSTFDGFWKMFTTTAGWIWVLYKFYKALMRVGISRATEISSAHWLSATVSETL